MPYPYVLMFLCRGLDTLVQLVELTSLHDKVLTQPCIPHEDEGTVYTLKVSSPSPGSAAGVYLSTVASQQYRQETVDPHGSVQGYSNKCTTSCRHTPHRRDYQKLSCLL